MSNHLPISSFLLLSKFFARLELEQILQSYFLTTDMNYVKVLSIEKSVLSFDNAVDSFQNREYPAATFLDPSKTFASVSHHTSKLLSF
jgi:hypothetical protein